MALYPSLEDMKVDQMAQAQVRQIIQTEQPSKYPNPNELPKTIFTKKELAAMYPALGDYMGMELSENEIAMNMPEYSDEIAIPMSRFSGMIAPVSGESMGLLRAQITNGLRELIICKDANNKVGLRVKAINKGIFVCLVSAGSPAALAGIRFGDQILQINGESVAGFTKDKVHDIFRKCPVNGIVVVVRDRPFERTITLHKDSTGHIGFQFKNGKIVSIVKDSSAARNGVLIEHHLLEINGQNVVGMKDKEVTRIIEGGGDIITVTVIPTLIYDHMIKNMSSSLLKGAMDHSIPSIF